MGEALTVFRHEQFGEIRTVEINGEPWFVGKDVALALGYQNPSKALRDHVDKEDKLNNESLSSLGQRGGWLVNESGIYSLAFDSKLPDAKKFKRWVTSEVLPSIRKTGGYVNDEELFVRTYLPFADEGTKALFSSTLTALREANRKIEADKPKVLFADAVSAANTSILVGELAKLLRQNGVQIGQNRLFDFLRDKGYLIRRRGSDYNLPTQRAMEMKLFEIKETVINQPDGSIRVSKTTKVTGKGQQYFVNLFLKGGADNED